MSLSPSISHVSRASVINRTHRVVREKARLMQERRSRARALLIPLLVASSLVIILASAFWAVMDEYEPVPTGIPDSRFQLPILLIWFLPVTGALLIVALLQRFRARSTSQGAPGSGSGEGTR